MSEDQTINPTSAAAKTASSSDLSRRVFVGGGAAAGAALAAGVGLRSAGAAPGQRGLRAVRNQDGPVEIVIGTLGDADTLNPFHSSDNSESVWRSAMLFDEFVRPDPQTYAATPGLAASWEIADLSFTFTLQPDVTFSDGTPVTAEDVKFTIEGVLNPATASNSAVKFSAIAGVEEYNADTSVGVSGIEVVDPTTVKITLAQPDAAFLYNMRYVHVVPKALLDGKDLSKGSTDPFFQAPVGAGPYIYESWNVGADFVANANASYWEGEPAIGRLIHRTIPDASALVNALLSGDIDGSLYPSPTLVEDIRANADLEVLVPPFNAPNGSFFNCREAPLDNPQVRLALAMATNVDEYVASSTLGLGEAGLGPIAPDSWAFDPSLTPIPYDPDTARTMLEEAGVAGTELTMLCNAGNLLREDWLIRCQADWEQVGVTLNIEFIEWATLVERITVTQDFQIIGADFAGVTAEPSELFEQFHSTSSGNYSGYANPELDALLEEAKATLDQEAAKPIYSEIQQILMRDVAMHHAWYRPFIHVVRKEFSGYTGSNLDGGVFRTLPVMSATV